MSEPLSPGPLLRPRGPLSPRTYWRRRLVVGGLALVLLALLLRACTGGSTPATTPTGTGATPSSSPSVRSAAPSSSASAGQSPSAGPSPSVGPSASASPSPSAAPVAACAPGDVTLDVGTARESFPAGGPVRVTVAVGTRGAGPCTVDVGPGAVQVVVVSGSDRIWARQDCDGAGAQVVTVAPDAPVAADVTWPGRRSRPGCPAGLERAAARHLPGRGDARRDDEPRGGVHPPVSGFTRR